MSINRTHHQFKNKDETAVTEEVNDIQRGHHSTRVSQSACLCTEDVFSYTTNTSAMGHTVKHEKYYKHNNLHYLHYHYVDVASISLERPHTLPHNLPHQLPLYLPHYLPLSSTHSLSPSLINSLTISLSHQLTHYLPLSSTVFSQCHMRLAICRITVPSSLLLNIITFRLLRHTLSIRSKDTSLNSSNDKSDNSCLTPGLTISLDCKRPSRDRVLSIINRSFSSGSTSLESRNSPNGSTRVPARYEY
jgi:hypothetical protein